jgi:hypothetical protein
VLKITCQIFQPEKLKGSRAMTAVKRYDAWGNPILPREEMIRYYASDEKSLRIVRNNIPCRTVVLPEVEIRIFPECVEQFEVLTVYPGGQVSKVHDMTEKALKALRTAYRGKKGWTHEKTAFGCIVLRHKGRVILESTGKCLPGRY